MHRTGRTFTASLAVVALLLSGLSMVSDAYAQGTFQPPHSRPGPAADRLIFRAFAVDVAPAALERGDIDLYLFSLRTTTARELLGRADIAVYQAPASSNSIILNPAPAPAGQLNPFSIREVRFAMNFLVNREFVAQQIYRGLAVPMVTHVSPLDFDYLNLADLVRGRGITYDPELAKSLIAPAMTKAGAELRDGKWFFRGRPIILTFIVRVEDERREIGDLIRAELERLGFTLQPVYQQFGPAITTVYSTDPSIFAWHLYTEGWGRGSPERYDFATLNQMCAPWLGNMPGWQQVGWWQYQNPTLDDVGKRIFTGSFSSLDERNRLYREATTACLDESVRIWVATVVNSFPALPSVQGVTRDLVAGPRSLWTFREAFIPGRADLKVGHLWVWTERTIWNPIGGLGDVFSVDIWRNLQDPPVARHPFSGLPIPFRAKYSVQTAGPTGKLAVPRDAFRWDPQAGRWQAVPTDMTATSKVAFRYDLYTQSRWHHGQPVTIADILYSIHQQFDMTYNPQKSRVEVALATVARPFLDTFKAFRLVNSTTLEVYVDYWHFVPDFIAEYASPSGVSMPWELLAAMDSLVFEKRQAAYSDTAAAQFNVPWLSLVMDRDARLVERVLREFIESQKLPKAVFEVGGRTIVSTDEAVARYRASADWFRKRGHMVISNGPFQLERYDPPAQFAELVAFRDATYPFKPGQWFFGAVESVRVRTVETRPLVIGSAVQLKVAVDGPGQLGLKYQLFDPAKGQVLDRGDVAPSGPGNEFVIQLPARVTAQLRPGTYQLILAAFSDRVATVAERITTLEAVREAPPTQPPPPATITPPTTPPPPAPPQQVGEPVPIQLVLPAVGVLVIVGVLAAWKLRRRPAAPGAA